jgi:hypothetical protein
MSRTIYNWLIVYDDGDTETVAAESPVAALYDTEKDYDYEGVRAVIRMDYA